MIDVEVTELGVQDGAVYPAGDELTVTRDVPAVTLNVEDLPAVADLFRVDDKTDYDYHWAIHHYEDGITVTVWTPDFDFRFQVEDEEFIEMLREVEMLALMDDRLEEGTTSLLLNLTKVAA